MPWNYPKTDYPRTFPPIDFYVSPEDVEEAQQLALTELVQTDADETTIDGFLRKNPGLLAACMNFTQFGHHGTWVVPQQLIRTPSLPASRGLKPDYLVGASNSGGYCWYVVELKSPASSLFTRKKAGGLALSSVANSGICQLLQYLDYASEVQSYLRDSLKLTGFREPKGFLIIGREAELLQDPNSQDLRRALNQTMAGRLEIRTFDALVRSKTDTWISEGVVVEEV